MTRHIQRILPVVALLLAALVPTSCARNNGDIGVWFGTWQMTAVEIDGVPLAGYERNIFWKFQNDILGIVAVNTDDPVAHSWYRAWGAWWHDRDRDNAIIVKFTYTDDNFPSGGPGSIYDPSVVPGLAYGTLTPLDVASLKGLKMTLVNHCAADGLTYTYHLERQP